MVAISLDNVSSCFPFQQMRTDSEQRTFITSKKSDGCPAGSLAALKLADPTMSRMLWASVGPVHNGYCTHGNSFLLKIPANKGYCMQDSFLNGPHTTDNACHHVRTTGHKLNSQAPVDSPALGGYLGVCEAIFVWPVHPKKGWEGV
jgi:hypothetical protein